ncbi:hypothetical protein [Burkholderia sp. HI2500]|uniref:hypothetical protein n=1 Tax=Burkholderia sp. HI2500 TaxID=2015358 RepID=UPI0015C64B09|nr:hypothetical protein [Burkholderia sp. HI2500]
MKTKMNVKLTGIALSVAALFSVAASASEAVVVTSVPGSLSNADGVIIGGWGARRHRGGLGERDRLGWQPDECRRYRDRGGRVGGGECGHQSG